MKTKEQSIICGDARKFINTNDPQRTVIITDPIWPNTPDGMFDETDPFSLLHDVLNRIPCRRIVIVLGRRSDPRFLRAVPDSKPFVCMCWLRYDVPSYAGTVLISADVAYVFGSHEGPFNRTVISEGCSVNKESRVGNEHPCPRMLRHMSWIIANLTRPDDLVIDPFAGSGTTLRACKDHGREAVGIEIREDYCAIARRRLRQEVLPLSAKVGEST